MQSPAEAEAALKGQLVVPIEDPVEVQRRIVEQILEADNVDDILGNKALTTSGSDMLGVPFTLHAVQIMRSGMKGGLGVFAVLDIELEDGKELKLTTGAGNVMAQAVALWRGDFLPYKVMIVEAETESASGFKPQRLEAA